MPWLENTPIVTPQTDTPSYTLDDLELQVVAACLADSDILEFAAARYRSRFRGQLSSLFEAAYVYFNVTRSILTRNALSSILMQNEPDFAKHDDYHALFDALTSPPYSTFTPEQRRWSVHQYDEAWQVHQTGEALSLAAEAMRSGHSAHGRTLTGAAAAWQVLSEKRIEYSNLHMGDAMAEGELTTSIDRIKQTYHRAVESKYVGVPLCVPEISDLLGSLRAGDMFVYTAYAHEGKSFLLINDAHHAWMSGKNVAIATGEMNLSKYWNRIVALHSNFTHPTSPLETFKVDHGLLTPEEHAIFLEALDDIQKCHDGKAGRLFCFQFPYNATPQIIFNRFASYDQIAPLDLIVIDYLGLITSERARVSKREEYDDAIRQTKALTLDFRGGSGVALQTAWQTNRTSFQRARSEGYYTLDCFSDSPEVEKSADAAVWLLSIPQNPDELKLGFVKNRDNEHGEHFFIGKHFKHAMVRSLKSTRVSPATKGAALLDV